MKTAVVFTFLLGLSSGIIGTLEAVSQPRCETSGYTISCYNIQSDSYSYLYNYLQEYRPTQPSTPYHTPDYSDYTDYTTYSPDYTTYNTDYTPYYTDYTADGSSETVLHFYDSILSDLPFDTFSSLYYYSSYPLYHYVFTNCSFREFPFYAMTYSNVNYIRSITVTDSYIAKFSASYMQSYNFESYLSTVTFTSNVLTEIPSGAFQSLQGLTTISMTNNKIVTIDSQAFYSLSYLRTVDLSGNRIQSISPTAFSSVSQLTNVSLHDNNLMTLTNGTFSKQKFPELIHLSLGGNPFICNCDLQWLKVYLEEDIEEDGSPSCVCPDTSSFGEVDFCGWD